MENNIAVADKMVAIYEGLGVTVSFDGESNLVDGKPIGDPDANFVAMAESRLTEDQREQYVEKMVEFSTSVAYSSASDQNTVATLFYRTLCLTDVDKSVDALYHVFS